jgi:hypothetical protein
MLPEELCRGDCGEQRWVDGIDAFWLVKNNEEFDESNGSLESYGGFLEDGFEEDGRASEE